MERNELVSFKTELEGNLKATELRAASLARKIAALDVLLEDDEPAPAANNASDAPGAAPGPVNHQPVAFFDVVRQVRKLKG
jgi:hypothetical protein